MSTDDIIALIRSLTPKAWEHTLVCPPALEQRMIDALDRPEFEGAFKIITSNLIPEGKIYVIDDSAIEKIAERTKWFD